MKPWLRLSVKNPAAMRSLRNASHRRKVQAKRWLRKAVRYVQFEIDRQIVNLVAYGTTRPERP